LEGKKMVRPERFELPTYCSGGNRSIHLSYGRTALSLHGRVKKHQLDGVEPSICRPTAAV
jgi:hypothetical protein